jgi:hypothetical protein
VDAESKSIDYENKKIEILRKFVVL